MSLPLMFETTRIVDQTLLNASSNSKSEELLSRFETIVKLIIKNLDDASAKVLCATCQRARFLHERIYVLRLVKVRNMILRPPLQYSCTLTREIVEENIQITEKLCIADTTSRGRALHAALKLNNVTLVRMLLVFRNIFWNDYFTALRWTVNIQDIFFARLLLEEFKHHFHAVENKMVVSIQQFLSSCISTAIASNCYEFVDETIATGMVTAESLGWDLCNVCQKGDIRFVQSILKCGHISYFHLKNAIEKGAEARADSIVVLLVGIILKDRLLELYQDQDFQQVLSDTFSNLRLQPQNLGESLILAVKSCNKEFTIFLLTLGLPSDLFLKKAWLEARALGLLDLERLLASKILKHYPKSPHFDESQKGLLFSSFC